MMIRSAAVLLCLGAALVSSASIGTPPHMWTKLILTHHWPTTFCGMEHCHAKMDSWKLHGLWPNTGQDCNSSWPFNASQIEDIRPDMESSWPDLLKPQTTEFWKYEWHKHGTCAAKAESLNSEHKYFSKALELYHKIDLTGTLAKSDIIPSINYYKFADVEAAIESVYGAKPKIQCAQETQGSGVQILGQIEVCFSSEFTLEDCTVYSGPWNNNNNNVEYAAAAAAAAAAAGPGPGPSYDTPFPAAKHGFRVCDPNLPVYYPLVPQTIYW